MKRIILVVLVILISISVFAKDSGDKLDAREVNFID